MSWKKLPFVRPLIQARYRFGQTALGKKVLYGGKTRRVKQRFRLGETSLVPLEAVPSEFIYELSVYCRIFNEGRFLREFVAYHLAVGVEHFYFYNNGSKDDTVEQLRPFVEGGLVTLIDFPQKPPSPEADIDCMQRFRLESKWIACIDADEFLLPMQGDDLKLILREYEEAAALMVCWRYFGSSGHRQRPEGLVIENYLRSSPTVVETLKSIVNPREVAEYGNPHFWYFGGDKVPVDENHVRVFGGTTLNPTAEKIRINHYYCKSEQDFLEKTTPDYMADSFVKHGNTRTVGNLKRTFERHNDVLDKEILRFVEPTKKIIAEYCQ